MNAVQPRLEEVRRTIVAAAQRAGRDPDSVRLIAVSKRQPAEAIRAAYACGQRDFGENYVQELLTKAKDLADLTDLRWHLIGHLQTNKAKLVCGAAQFVHTLDNERIVDELARRAEQQGRNLGVYVEVNIGEESQKSGCRPVDASALVTRIEAQPALSFLGLMTVGRLVDSAEAARETFRTLRRLRDEIAPGAELSMGMSGDYPVAVEEGATCVRVGTAIFGERSR